MLKFLGWMLTLLLVGAAVVAVIGTQRYLSPSPITENKIVIIAPGAGLTGIAEQLSYDQIVTDNWVFIAATVISGKQTKLKAGEYEFAAHVKMREVLRKLAKGEIVNRSVTVREGLTSYQVIQLINQTEKLSGAPITDIPAEGTLLPETYQFVSGDTRQDLVARMQKDMADTLASLWALRAKDLPITTPEEAVTLASIVEKETGIEVERRRVAGVFINRLKVGMKLQTDPTVIYALTKGIPEDDGKGPLGRRLLRKDLENTDSPYNTYMYAGLPPGPIANPGKASLIAVLNPEQHEFLYFVADGKGGHVFAKTANEHEQNVVDWRKIRAQNAAPKPAAPAVVAPVTP